MVQSVKPQPNFTARGANGAAGLGGGGSLIMAASDQKTRERKEVWILNSEHRERISWDASSCSGMSRFWFFIVA